MAENQETQWFTPTELSEQTKMSARQFNQLLAAASSQKKRGKKWELLDAGRAYARLFDTGKRHDPGVPVQQVKWSPTVIDAAQGGRVTGAPRYRVRNSLHYSQLATPPCREHVPR
jgi:hypothetical protein